MAVDLVVSVVAKVAEFFVAPIGRQIGYVFNYSSNIKNLKDEVENLALAKKRVLVDVEDARKNGDEIHEDVSKWLTSVDDVTKEANTVLEDIANSRCFMGRCPNLITRYQLSRKAKKATQDAADKLKVSKFDKVFHGKPPLRIGPVKDFEAFKSREGVMEKILKALTDADVYLIGVYGMSGVGKTTLVTEVACRSQERGIFKSVAIGTVTQTPELKAIQQEVAEYLHFKFDGEQSISARAVKLRERIKKEEKILVVLDDVWKKIDLDKIGIPYGKDDKGCKILMTSRDQNVFLEMDVQRDFQLHTLDDKEAWDLFQKTVGDFKDSALQPIGAEIAERCGGLPILIATIASALKRKDLPEWRNALKKLKTTDNQGIEAEILNVSYDFLDRDEKSLFLLCGQIGTRSFLSDLLKYSMGLGLFNQLTTVKESRDRLLTVVNDLKRRCFLLEGDNDDTVRMHDVVHKFATLVAEYDGAFTLAYRAESEEWPEKDIFERCTAISLTDGIKMLKFPDVLECPNLLSFLFYNINYSSIKIPDSFFNRVKKLKLLDLSDVHLSPMPSSLQFLENLQTLCLDRCVLFDIAAIGELKKLQVLSLMGSNIVQLPKQVGNLTRLRLLDLSECERLQVIPAGILSSLTRLEELYMGESFVQWEVEGRNDLNNNANLAELKLLSNLVTLQVQIIDANILPKDLFSGNLERFEILIGEEWNWDLSRRYEIMKRLKLQLSTNIRLERVKALLMRAEDLYLDEMKGIKSVLYDLERHGFPELKHLHVRNSLNIQHIIDNTRMGPSRHAAAFPKLESLTLDSLNSLEKICHGPIKAEAFCNLRKLNVTNCGRLKNLFSSSVSRGLAQLQEIDVSSCNIIEGIVAEETGDHNSSNDEEISLRRLCSLTLIDLPQFSSFMSQLRVPSVATTSASSKEVVYLDESESPVPLFNRKIIFPNLTDLRLVSIGVEKIWCNQLIGLSQCIQKLTTLVVDGCGSLKYLFTSSMIKSLEQLKKLEISNCKSMEEIIKAQELDGETMSNIFIRKLEFLELKCLQKLTRFCTGNFIECPSLKILKIESCDELETFIADSVSSNVTLANHDAGQTNSALFDQKVAFPELEELHIMNMPKLILIWNDEFQADSLKMLNVEHSNALLKIFSIKMLRGGFQNLEKLVVKNCDLVEEVFDELLVAVPSAPPKTWELRSLELRNLPNLKHVWKWNIEDSTTTVSFAGLEMLKIVGCSVLEEIVLKEETAKAKANAEFEFPQLKTLHLERLEQLKRFYFGSHILRCPKLQNLTVYECKSPTNVTLFSSIKVMPSFVQVDNAIIRQGQFLHFRSFEDNSPFKFPFHVLRVFQNVDHLTLEHSSWKEIFPIGIIIDGEDAIALARIRFLKLSSLPQLRHLWKEDFQRGQLLPNLESLEIEYCDGLNNLALFSASFQNLTTLNVSDCNGLINLVTTSATKGMVNLTHMVVKDCKMVTQIVADECQSESEIIFKKLTSLKLLHLRSLTSFSPSTSCTIKIPSLEEVLVSQCPKMTVFSPGVVCSSKLQKVHITDEMNECRWVKDLNTTIQQLHAQMVGFSGIEQLKLSEFPQLKNVWLDQSLRVNFFIGLRDLVVDDSEISLVAVPPNLLPCLNELRKLGVRNCIYVEDIFGPAMPNAIDGRTFEHFSLLEELELIDLPRLRQVWSELPRRFLDFKNLEVLKIHNCKSLRNVFSPAICSGFVQLREVEVKSCDMVEFIVAEDGAMEGTSVNEIKFPLLNSITLESLPRLNNFNSGSSVVHCPTLKVITIVDCPTTFASTFLRLTESLKIDITAEPKIIFPSLTDLRLVSIGVEKIWSNQLIELSEYIQSLTTLVVNDCEKLNYLFTSSMIESLVQLKKLEISNCKSTEEIIKAQELDGETMSNIFIRKLEFLELKCLLKLTTFCTGNFIECPYLKILKIESCDDLETFIADSVSSNVTLANHDAGQTNSALFDQKVAFPELEEFHIMDMHKLKHVWKWNIEDPTTTVSFTQLQTLEINDCSVLEEIVLKEETTKTIPKFVFPQLETLHLGRLEQLKSFYSGSHTLRCPKLQNLTVYECKRLKIFDSQAEEDMLSSTNMALFSSTKNTFPKDLKLSSCIPKTLTTLVIDGCENLSYLFTPSMIENFAQLRKLEICDCKSMKIVIAAEETTAKILFPELEFLKIKGCPRVNTFISNLASAYEVEQINPVFFDEKIACPNLIELQIFKMNNLKMIWDNQLHPNSFCKLEKLTVEDGKGLLKFFPATMLGRLQNLENLSVKNCDLVEEVFDLQQLVAPNLEDANNVAKSQLRILDIDNLPNLKHIWNMDPLGDLLFLDLCEIYVDNCSSLKWAFPASLAKEGLLKLERLSISYCCEMENIVAKKEGTEVTPKFVFPNLQFLELWELEKLKSFYPGIHILETPILEILRAFGCVNLETFEPQKLQKTQIEDERQFEIQVQSLFSFEKAIPNLSVLTLRSKDIPMIQLQGPFHTLKELELLHFHDKNLSSSPFDILPMFPNVETLALNSCDFEELFSDELVIDEKHATSLAQIRGLRLRRFPYLMLICSQKPQLEQVLQNIEELDVMLCDSLINLVPSSVSFSNLKKLKVWKCDKLVKLVTSQTASSMVHLTEMIVENCKMLKEIIANEEDEAQTKITLTRLQSLTLDCLMSLTVFSSATSTIKCPFLEEVIVIECPKMKVFSQGVVSAPELQKVYLNEEMDKWRWSKDLNTTLSLLYTEMNPLEE